VHRSGVQERCLVSCRAAQGRETHAFSTLDPFAHRSVGAAAAERALRRTAHRYAAGTPPRSALRNAPIASHRCALLGFAPATNEVYRGRVSVHPPDARATMTAGSSAGCYACGDALTGASASLEHIIPNAVGGVLASRRLLCVACNNKLGHEVDKDLCNYVAPLGVLIGVRRDAGNGRAVQIQRADGTVVLLDHEGRMRTPRPKFVERETDRGVDITVTAATKREAEKTFAGLQRKWGKKFRNVSRDPVSESIVEVDERMHFTLETGGPATNRAIAKIALGYYLHIGGDAAFVAGMIDYVRSGLRAGAVDAGWYAGPAPLAAEGDASLRHVVAVRGSASDGRLLGYVELFGSLHFAVVLADPYVGPDVSRAHIVTLVDRATDDLDGDALAGFPWPIADEPSAAAMEKGLTVVMRRANELAARRRFERVWGEELDAAIGRAMTAAANGRREIPATELWPHLARELQPWIESYAADQIDRRRQRAARTRATSEAEDDAAAIVDEDEAEREHS